MYVPDLCNQARMRIFDFVRKSLSRSGGPVRCYSDMCFPVARVPRTHNSRDICSPERITLDFVFLKRSGIDVPQGKLFPRLPGLAMP